MVVTAASSSLSAKVVNTTGLYGLPPLPLHDFNRLAAREGIPILWFDDSINPGTPDPAEIMALGVPAVAERYVEKGKFTKEFENIYRKLVEFLRKDVVASEMDQGLPTIVRTDLAKYSETDRDFVRLINKASVMIDRLFSRQDGALQFEDWVKNQDPVSIAMFNRDIGPWCVAPRTENNQFCNALPDFPEKTWDTYPADDIAALGQELCKKLGSLPDGKKMMNPFTVVRKDDGVYKAVPYNEAYRSEMREIASILRSASKIYPKGEEEALRSYLLATATSFETNDWGPADESWASMNSRNSKWYLRIAPDEVYWDLCQQKAGFHTSFALIDMQSLKIQDMLMPLREEMEKSLEQLPNSGYKARQVAFHMPDFIEIVFNAGDSKSPLGATIGQSLPNWGKVAEEGRGRTVVMTNLYQDPESKRLGREKASLLIGPDTMKYYTDDKFVSQLDIVLHEATHNLGPHSDYKVDQKNPGEIFGGHLASTLEELKAQTGALFYVELLRKKGLITDDQARQIYTHALVWGFGHISQGMVAATGNPKPYSQLAAVQVGWLMEHGGLSWEMFNDQTSGKQTGRFVIHYEKVPEAVAQIMQRVVSIKAKGDVQGAKALIEPYVSGEKKGLVHMEEIAERLLKFPRASMVYSVNF